MQNRHLRAILQQHLLQEPSRAARIYDPAVASLPAKRKGVIGAALTGALAAAMLGGCAASAPPAPSPAGAVPARAPLYIALDVSQEGALARLTRTDAARVTGAKQPYGFLYRLLSLRGGSAPRSAVLPFLGAQAGVFLERMPPLEAANGSPAALIAFARSIHEGGLRHLAGAAVPGALIADVTDPGGARAYIRRQSAGLHARILPFGGVKMTILSDGQAAAVARSFLLMGNIAGVRSAIATIDGAPALRPASPFAAMHAAAPTGAVAAVYLRLPSRAEASEAGSEGEAQSSSAQSESSGSLTANPKAAKGARSSGRAPASAGEPPYLRELIGPPGSALYVSLVPRSGSIRLVVDRLRGESADPPSTSESEQQQSTQQLLASLPESSWVAAALENLPDALHKVLALAPALAYLSGAAPSPQGAASGSEASFRSAPLPFTAGLQALLGTLAGLGGSSLAGLIAPARQLVGALGAHPRALRQALAGWMGPAALFLSGTSLLEVDGAIVISSRDEARSRAAVAQLGALFRSAHIAVKPSPSPGRKARSPSLSRVCPAGFRSPPERASWWRASARRRSPRRYRQACRSAPPPPTAARRARLAKGSRRACSSPSPSSPRSSACWAPTAARALRRCFLTSTRSRR